MMLFSRSNDLLGKCIASEDKIIITNQDKFGIHSKMHLNNELVKKINPKYILHN